MGYLPLGLNFRRSQRTSDLKTSDFGTPTAPAATPAPEYGTPAIGNPTCIELCYSQSATPGRSEALAQSVLILIFLVGRTLVPLPEVASPKKWRTRTPGTPGT